MVGHPGKWGSEAGIMHTVIKEIDNYTVHYYGDRTTRNNSGIAKIVNKEVNSCVLGFVEISDRIALIKTRDKSVNSNNIKAYASTTNKSDYEAEIFHEESKVKIKKNRCFARRVHH